MSTNQQWNQRQMPEDGNPQMKNKSRGYKGLIVTLIILALLIVGGFLAYKVLFEEKGGRLIKPEQPADSLQIATEQDTLAASLMDLSSEAGILGFPKGIKYAVCEIEDKFGFNYRFNPEGQLYEVYCYNYGTNSTVFMKDSRAVRCEGLEGPYEDLENPPVAEEFSSDYEYRQAGDSTEVFSKPEGEPAVKMGTYYYDEKGRIARAVNNDKTWEFTYNDEGKAFDQDGAEVYPPIVFFFPETPTLPKKFKVTKKDDQGRVTEAEGNNGRIHYQLIYE